MRVGAHTTTEGNTVTDTLGGDLAHPQMLASVIDSSPSLADLMNDLIGPIIKEREAIRDYLGAQGYISTLPDGQPLTPIGCTDGACTSSPLAIGDHNTTLAVAVQANGNAYDVAGHRSWAAFHAHTASSDALIKAVMMTHELDLLSVLDPYGIAIIDGSHATHITAITDLLANGDQQSITAFTNAIAPETITAAIEYALTNQRVVAQQKQDSSTAIWDDCSRNLLLTGTGLPDKPLAALILNNGEALTHPGSKPAWDRVRRHVTGAKDGTLLKQISDLVAPVVTQDQLVVTHLKPEASDFALRVEHKASLDDFTTTDYLLAIAHECAAPHVQEPFVQYLADKFAKNVSAVSGLQLETARMDTAEAGYPELLTYVLHYYRT